MTQTIFTDLGHQIVYNSEEDTFFDFITLLCFCGECSVEWAAKQLQISTDEVAKEVTTIIETHNYVGANCMKWKEDVERGRFNDVLGDIEINL